MTVEPSQTDLQQARPDKPMRDRDANFDVRNPSMMVEKPGWLLRLMGSVFFHRVLFEDEEVEVLHDLHRDGTVIYVFKSQSLLDYLYFNWSFLKKSVPRAVFGKGMRMWPFRTVGAMLHSFFRRIFGRRKTKTDEEIITNATIQGKPVAIFLRKARSLLPWWDQFPEDPLRSVVAAQRSMEQPVYVVPVLLFWERAPEKFRRTIVDVVFGDPDAPGRIRKLVNFVGNHRRAIAKVGEPLNLKTYLEEHVHLDRPEAVGQKIRWSLNQQFRLEQKVIRGPTLKGARQIREEILRGAPLTNQIEQLAAELGQPKEQVREEAAEYLKEIAANWKLGYVEVFCIALTLIFSRIYRGIEMSGLGAVREAAKKAPLIVLPCHRSHIDYLLISFMFYSHGLVPPHIAAGNNLNFFPIGHLFRGGGAFFLRRSFSANNIYSATFRTYVHKLLKEGYSVEFFLEGGRSRTGKLLKPRYGLLTHVVDAVVDGHCRDLSICPAAIGYEKILEASSYKRELGGASKEKENLEQLFKATSVLTSRWGRVYVDFDGPFSLREFLENEGVNLETGFVDETQRRLTIKRLAYRVYSGINNAMVCTASAVVAQALLGNTRRGISRTNLMHRVGAIIDYLLQRGAPLARVLSQRLAANRAALDNIRPAGGGSPGESLSGICGKSIIGAKIGECLAEVIDQTTDMFVDNKILTKHQYEGETVFQLPPDHRLDLDYYMNTIVHHFARESLLAAALLRCWSQDDLFGDRLRKETHLLSQLLRLEYVFEQRKDFQTQYRETVQLFEDAGLMTGDRAARIVLPRDADQTLRLLAHLTLPVIEGYFVVARGAATLEEAMPEKEFMTRLQVIGDRLWREGMITYKEAVSSVTFDNALSRLQEEQLVRRTTQKGKKKPIKIIAPGKKALEEPNACSELADHLAEFIYRRM